MKDVNSDKLSRGTQTPRSCSCSRSPAVTRATPPIGGALPPLQMRTGGGAVHPNQSRTISPTEDKYQGTGYCIPEISMNPVLSSSAEELSSVNPRSIFISMNTENSAPDQSRIKEELLYNM